MGAWRVTTEQRRELCEKQCGSFAESSAEGFAKISADAVLSVFFDEANETVVVVGCCCG